MATTVELYEALKDKIGGKTARMLAESIHDREVATRDDVEAIVQREILTLKAEIADFKADMRNWLLVFFVPLWLTMLALVAAVIWKA